MSFVVYWAADEYSKHNSHTFMHRSFVSYFCPHWFCNHPTDEVVQFVRRTWATEWLQGNRIYQLAKQMEIWKCSCWFVLLVCCPRRHIQFVSQKYLSTRHIICLACIFNWWHSNFATFLLTMQYISLFSWNFSIPIEQRPCRGMCLQEPGFPFSIQKCGRFKAISSIWLNIV